jgi:hypothetical protein
MNTYRKIPVEVQAVRWTGDNLQEIRAFGARCILSVQGGWKLDLASHGGTVTALCGDFIVRDADGEFDRCDPERFAQTYERVLR